MVRTSALRDVDWFTKLFETKHDEYYFTRRSSDVVSNRGR